MAGVPLRLRMRSRSSTSGSIDGLSGSSSASPCMALVFTIELRSSSYESQNGGSALRLLQRQLEPRGNEGQVPAQLVLGRPRPAGQAAPPSSVDRQMRASARRPFQRSAARLATPGSSSQRHSISLTPSCAEIRGAVQRPRQRARPRAGLPGTSIERMVSAASSYSGLRAILLRATAGASIFAATRPTPRSIAFTGQRPSASGKKISPARRASGR